MRLKLLGILCSFTALGAMTSSALGAFGDYRALFVNRFEYSYNTSSINAIFQNAANLGITDVMFQVRGRGDAFYDSNFEPRAIGLSTSFDPLQTAINAAHSRGIKIHAWMNTTPMWQGSLTPSAGHMYYNINPSFRLTNNSGAVEPQEGWSGGYSSVNPILPEVHAHINNVVNDIATNYDVDGIHLDYIRYIPGNSFSTLPHDAISHQMFQAATGLNGASSSNAVAYRNYIEQRITDLVGSIRQTVDAAELLEGRDISLSASVWRDPDIAENDYMQDYRTWLEQDLLDVAMPMIYLTSSNDHLFNPNLLNSLNIQTNTRVAPTLGVYLHNADAGGVDLTISQLQRAHTLGAYGAGFYGYGAMFNESLSSARRSAIMNFYDSIEEPPGSPGNIIDDFENNESHFGWNYNYSSQTVGLSAATTINRVTTQAQAGIASQELNLVDSGAGTWTLRHNSGIGSVADPAGNVALPATGYIGFWLKTNDPGITVQIALDDPGTADRGILQQVIADNQWHLYQWNLENDLQWDPWVTGDGTITGPTITIDSIFFYGDGNATIYLDSVTHNPNGPIAALIPGDFDRDGDVDGDDLAQWQGDFGENDESDADGDGDSDGRDFIIWQRNFTGSLPLTATATSIPEPTSLALTLLIFAAVGGRRP
jgi:uncharacterized lipoprotein YddW (UPF0748 family)